MVKAAPQGVNAMTVETDVEAGRHFRARKDERQFRLVYAVTFAISLVAVVFARLAPWRRRTRAHETHKSIIGEAKARTSRIVPFLFMG
jgi:hypothetical protein